MAVSRFTALLLALTPAPVTMIERSAEPELTAADVATAVQEGLPNLYDGGISMVAAAAELEVLVVRFDVHAAIAAQLNPVSIAREFAAGLCDGGDAGFHFERGMRLRVDTSVEGGTPRPGLLIGRCPGARA